MSTLDREVPTKGISPAIMDLVNKTGEFLEQNVAFQLRMDEAEARINTLQKEVKQARRDSYVDALTNLYNRRYFDQRFTSLIDDDLRSPYCLVIADIDNFKHINDTYGHLLGDRVIQRVADIISDKASGSCIPARLGGEEFGLLIANAGIIDAIKVAKTMRSEVRKIVIKSKRDPSINFGLTASFGVAQLKTKDSAEDLIDRADKALYQAKNKGKDRVEAL
jgi:diguanylate cyclase